MSNRREAIHSFIHLSISIRQPSIHPCIYWWLAHSLRPAWFFLTTSCSLARYLLAYQRGVGPRTGVGAGSHGRRRRRREEALREPPKDSAHVRRAVGVGGVERPRLQVLHLRGLGLRVPLLLAHERAEAPHRRRVGRGHRLELPAEEVVAGAEVVKPTSLGAPGRKSAAVALQ